MSRRDARKIAARLRDAGHRVVFAGGAVRDRLLGLRPRPVEVDLATSASVPQVQALFERTVAVGRAFGVVQVLWAGVSYDVASFRKDVGIGDGRHPAKVEPSTLEEDVQRRDFTINGMVEDPFSGEVTDLVGGRADLERGLVRCIGDPALRFREDGLRLLRAVRFAARLGFELEQGTARAMAEQAQGLARVSGERVREELRHMLRHASRRRALELLDSTGLLPHFLPELSAMHGVQQPPQFHPEGDVWVHTCLALQHLRGSPSFELALGTLLHDVGKPPTFRRAPDRIRFDGHVERGAAMAEEICRRLRLSRASARCVVALVRDHLLFKDVPRMRPARLRRLMASEHFDQLLELYRADCRASHGRPSALGTIHAMRRKLRAERPVPPPLLAGRDVLALGLAPGPEVGRVLAEAADLQLDGALPDRTAALDWLRRRVRSERSS